MVKVEINIIIGIIIFDNILLLNLIKIVSVSLKSFLYNKVFGIFDIFLLEIEF